MPPVNMPANSLSYAQSNVKRLQDMGVITQETADQLSGFPGPQQMEALQLVESGGNPSAVSPKGAQGLNQLMPDTAKEVAQSIGLDPSGVDLMNPEINKRLAAIYLQRQAKTFGSPALGFAAYNAGPGRVQEAINRAGTDELSAVMEHLPKETRDYLPKIERAGGLPSGTISQFAQRAPESMDGLSAVKQGYDTQRAAMLEKMLAEEKAQGELQEVRQSEQQRLEQEYKREQQKQQAQADSVQKAATIYTRALDEGARGGIDPDRYYKNQTTGDKVLAGIAIALSGVASGMQGRGGNMAIDLINQAIDRDIEAQKIDLQQRTISANAKGTMFNMLRQQLQDDKQATEMLRALQTEGAKQKIESIKEGLQRTEQKAEAEKLIGQLSIQQQESLQKIAQWRKDQPEYFAEQADKLVGGKTDAANVPKELRELVIPGFGIAQDPQSKKDASTALTNFRGVNSGLSQLIEMRQDDKFRIDPEKRAEMATIATDTKLQLKEIAKLGVISGPDMELLNKMIPENPAEWKAFALPGIDKDPILAALKTTQRRTQEKFTQGINQYMMKLFPEGEKTLLGATPFNPVPR